MVVLSTENAEPVNVKFGIHMTNLEIKEDGDVETQQKGICVMVNAKIILNHGLCVGHSSR